MIVTIINSSACSACHANGACSVADTKEKDVEITMPHSAYSPGEEVTVLFQESAGFKALFFGYILPFILVLTVLIVIFSVLNHEILAGLLALGILIPYYITLYFFREKLKKVFKFEVEETS